MAGDIGRHRHIRRRGAVSAQHGYAPIGLYRQSGLAIQRASQCTPRLRWRRCGRGLSRTPMFVYAGLVAVCGFGQSFMVWGGCCGSGQCTDIHAALVKAVNKTKAPIPFLPISYNSFPFHLHSSPLVAITSSFISGIMQFFQLIIGRERFNLSGKCSVGDGTGLELQAPQYAALCLIAAAALPSGRRTGQGNRRLPGSSTVRFSLPPTAST